MYFVFLCVYLGIIMYMICYFNFGICVMYFCKVCIYVYVVFFLDYFCWDVGFVILIY